MTSSPCVVSRGHFNGTPPAEVAETYLPVFLDDFDQPAGSSLDYSVWDTQFPWGPNLIINNEGQYYPNVKGGDARTPNPFIMNGDSTLTIRTGLNNAAQQADTGQQYYSGIINTFNTFVFKYGYVESRIKLPENNQGLWAAFWLLNRFYRPSPDATGPNGKFETEIDWEWVRGPGGIFGGGPYTTDSSQNGGGGALAMHYDAGQWSVDGSGFKGPGGSPGASQQCDGTPISNVQGLPFAGLPSGADLALDFHNYGIWWTDQFVRWYLDGVEVASVCDANIVSQIKMYLLCNVACEGNFPGAANPADYVNGSDMLVDWICVLQHPTHENGI